MDVSTYVQIGITIIMAIIVMYGVGRVKPLSLSRYFTGLLIFVAIFNSFAFLFLTNLFMSPVYSMTAVVSNTNSPADILKDMTTQYEFPERSSGGSAYLQKIDKGKGCPVIAL